MTTPVMLVGNITADPKIRTTSGGKKYTIFTIAENVRARNDGEEDRTFFHTVQASDGQYGFATKVVDVLHKGAAVIVSGVLETYSETVWVDDKDNEGELKEVNATRSQIIAWHIGPDLAGNQTVTVTRNGASATTGRTRPRPQSAASHEAGSSDEEGFTDSQPKKRSSGRRAPQPTTDFDEDEF